jgi:hypothetical protein
MALCFDGSHIFGPKGTRQTAIFGGETYTFVSNNGQKSLGNAPETGYCCHWEVDSHHTVWDDYNGCVAENTEHHAVAVLTLKPGDKPQATWGRNTGIFNLAFCAMATPADTPDDAMVAMMGRWIGERCARHGINPRGTLTLPKKVQSGSQLVNAGGTITVPVIHDHRVIAEHDGYFPDRWDIGDPRVNGKPSLLPRVQATAYATYDAVMAGQAYELSDAVLA